MKYSFSGLALALCVLLTAAFVAGCSGEQPTEQPTPTRGDSQPTEQPTPTVERATATFAAISSGADHACRLREDGSPACWSYNGNSRGRPPKGETFVAISSGAWYTCGLREDGSAVC